MPTVVIPEKVCKKCGGTTWFDRKDRKIQECKNCRKIIASNWNKNNREYYRKYQKRGSNNLTDYYIKSRLYYMYKHEGILVKREGISPKEIEMERKKLEIERKLNPRKMKEGYTLEQIDLFKKEYNELGEEVKDKSLTRMEKQTIYNRRTFLKQKFTIADYENLIALGPEKEEIISPPEEQLVPVIIPALNMAEELSRKKKELEEKVNRIGEEVLAFNEYIESFKIIL